jgi:hypothetical protein
MKLSNKVSIWLYGLAMIAGFVNAFSSYNAGNGDAAFAWVVSAGLAGGALGAHLEIKEIKEEEDDK